jgi:hypothetical protein
LWGHAIKTFYQTNTTRQIIETIIEAIIVSILCIIGVILVPLLIILNHLIIILWELFKISLPLIVYWFVYKIMAVSIIEFIGIIPLVIFNTLIILLILVQRVETRELRYNFISENQLRKSLGLSYNAYIPFLTLQGLTWGQRIYTQEGKYSEIEEYYPCYDIFKLRGVCLADWVVICLCLYLAFFFILLPITFLIVNAYVLSIKILLPIIISFISGIVLNFPSDFDVLYMLTCPIIPIKTSKSSKSNTSKTKLPTDKFKTDKFKTLNGLKIPGVLFHFSKYSKKLMTNFINCIGSTLETKSLIFVADYIDNEIKLIRSIMRTGFIYEEDLTCSASYPVVSSLVEDFLLKELPKASRTSKASKDEVDLTGKTPLERLDYAGIKVKADLFKEIYYLICLNYWTLNRILLNHIKEEQFAEKYPDFKDSDSFIKLQHLNTLLTKLLPNSIKRHLHNKSVSLTNNIYAGFDTEFKNIDKNTNKLLSIQVSVNGCYTLKIPTLVNRHAFGSLDVSTSRFYETKPESKLINYFLIDTFIQEAIDFNINLNWEYKQFITSLTDALIAKGVKYYVKENYFHFKFPSSDILTKFIEIKNSFSMVNLFNTIIDLDRLNETKAIMFENILNSLNIKPDGVWNALFENLEYNELKTDTVYDSVFDSNTNSDFAGIEKGETTQKRRIRKGLKFNRWSVYTNNIIYLTAHYNAADLSMLSDFETYKPFLNVVNKSFVVINKPIPFIQEVLTDDGVITKNWNMKISDTMLLSPPGYSTLKQLGEIYNFNKLELTEQEITNMDLLLIDDRPKFKDYAVRDSIITLLHYNAMIDYIFGLETITPPTTLSQISGRALDKYWNSINYEGYQVSPMYSLADANKVYTFKGLFETPNIGDKLPLFIQTFRGGRNECFCYGMDTSGKIWYDYDLTSAYTTIMYGLANPIYNKGKFITSDKFFKEFNKDNEFLLKNYFAIKCSFKFPNSVNYPCLPCNYDSENTIYPLNGKGVYTGSEILAALNLKCAINIEEVFMVPKGIVKIFGFIKELHLERGKHDKGSFENLMCKIIGNSAYGLTAQGINEIMRYDTVSNRTVRMKDSRFSNPIIAANISSFIRALLAEIMNNIDNINGKIVSVTTDGFITDIPDLENLLLDKINKGEWKGDLLKSYRTWRSEITNGANPDALEIKKSGPNMMSWTTRGQLSIDSGIAALTGLQRKSFNGIDHISTIVKDLFNSNDKTLEFISMRLRTASDIFKKGGHVTSILADKAWSIIFDHKRKVIIEDNDLISDYRNKLFFTKPHFNVEDAWGFRTFNKTVKTGDIYHSTYLLSLSFWVKNKNLNSLY